MTQELLSEVKVLDVTHGVAGPFCTRILADLGAEVLKIEEPGGGDPARRVGPFPGDEPHPEESGLFLYLNMNRLFPVRGRRLRGRGEHHGLHHERQGSGQERQSLRRRRPLGGHCRLVR